MRAKSISRMSFVSRYVCGVSELIIDLLCTTAFLDSLNRLWRSGR